ncbi:MAG: diaminopimelate decarboxylase [Pseudomonadota bacterium]|nr:diaminopimelate decarboxylase [Pseudomonadota bacterium]
MSYKIFNCNDLSELARNHETPCYIYDSTLLADTLQKAQTCVNRYFGQNATIHYALKANDNSEVLTKIKQSGFGIDCVSGGEIEHALDHGFLTQQIVFAGVGKQDWEIELGLNVGIYAFNCESIQEVTIINNLAGRLGKQAKIMLRVNPDIDARTHKHISTGMYDNKFGITFDDVLTVIQDLKNLTNIQLVGLHYHIGSQITDMQVFAQLGAVVSKHYAQLTEYGCHLTDINLGGGLGVDYINPQANPIAAFDEYFAVLSQNLLFPNRESIKIHFELGRSLVAQSGIVLSKVLFLKSTAGTNFVVIDAGMNDLMRPMLYEAKHVIMPLIKKIEVDKYHVVGPVCESTDVFAKNIELPILARGDVIAILTCGAYGRVLANQYNRRKMVQEYVI